MAQNLPTTLGFVLVLSQFVSLINLAKQAQRLCRGYRRLRRRNLPHANEGCVGFSWCDSCSCVSNRRPSFQTLTTV